MISDFINRISDILNWFLWTQVKKILNTARVKIFLEHFIIFFQKLFTGIKLTDSFQLLRKKSVIAAMPIK